MRCHSLWLSSHIASSSMAYSLVLSIFIPWCVSQCCELINLSVSSDHHQPDSVMLPAVMQKTFHIKLSFNNHMQLALFILPLILTIFLVPSLFMNHTRIRFYLSNLERNAVLVSSLNVIVFLASEYHNPFLFDQFNLAFRLMLVN